MSMRKRGLKGMLEEQQAEFYGKAPHSDSSSGNTPPQRQGQLMQAKKPLSARNDARNFERGGGKGGVGGQQKASHLSSDEEPLPLSHEGWPDTPPTGPKSQKSPIIGGRKVDPNHPLEVVLQTANELVEAYAETAKPHSEAEKELMLKAFCAVFPHFADELGLLCLQQEEGQQRKESKKEDRGEGEKAPSLISLDDPQTKKLITRVEEAAQIKRLLQLHETIAHVATIESDDALFFERVKVLLKDFIRCQDVKLWFLSNDMKRLRADSPRSTHPVELLLNHHNIETAIVSRACYTTKNVIVCPVVGSETGTIKVVIEAVAHDHASFESPLSIDWILRTLRDVGDIVAAVALRGEMKAAEEKRTTQAHKVSQLRSALRSTLMDYRKTQQGVVDEIPKAVQAEFCYLFTKAAGKLVPFAGGSYSNGFQEIAEQVFATGDPKNIVSDDDSDNNFYLETSIVKTMMAAPAPQAALCNVLGIATSIAAPENKDFRDVALNVAIGATLVFGCQHAHISFVDKERAELEIHFSPDKDPVRIPSSSSLEGLCLRKKSRVNVSDAYLHPDFLQELDSQLKIHCTSVLVEPVLYEEEVLAILSLVNKETASGIEAFDDKDEAMSKAFAAFVAVVVHKAHLLQFTSEAATAAVKLSHSLSSVHSHAAHVEERILASGDIEALMNYEVEPADLASATTVEFNLFSYIERNGPSSVVPLICRLILVTGLPQRFGCSEETLFRFVVACKDKYRKVPYHNFFHAVDVCQTIYTYLYQGKLAEKLEPLECFVILATGLMHDLDHMGLNNSFLLRTDAPLGILSSASGHNSVLEVHHCNLAIGLLDGSRTNIFGGMSEKEHSTAYQIMIDCILATDMARHKELVTNFVEQMKPSLSAEDKLSQGQRLALCQAAIKAADISNVTKPFPISRKWGANVTEEFYRQGDQEKERGLDVAPQFDRSRNTELARGQLGFIRFVALPYFKTLVDIGLSGMSFTMEGIEANVVQWEEELEASSPIQA